MKKGISLLPLWKSLSLKNRQRLAVSFPRLGIRATVKKMRKIPMS
jgi:hypothetical protein